MRDVRSGRRIARSQVTAPNLWSGEDQNVNLKEVLQNNHGVNAFERSYSPMEIWIQRGS